MEFRILGPLQVYEGGAALSLAGERQRTLLAILLVNPNRVLSSDRLCDELWRGQPPETAPTALQGHVFELRRILEPDHVQGMPYRVVATERPGYVLRVAPDDLDAERFRQLVNEGRQALDRSSPRTAARVLRDALSLWRGPPLADLGFEPALQQEIAELEELRLTAIELQVEADLALGRHGEVIAELQALIREQPLRERPRGQLMLALYRAGRQAEALAAYREARVSLVEELGIEPGTPLQDLERAILVHDPSLELATPVAEVETNVPVPANRLVGRDREVAAISVLLRRPDVRLLTLTGAGGSGKSRLALEVTLALREEFEHGVFLVRLGRISDADLVAPTIAQTLAVEERAGESLLVTLEDALRGREYLLLADNFEHLLDAGPLLTRLLAVAPRLKLLVTSRSPLRVLGEHEYPVAPLSLPEISRPRRLEALTTSDAVTLFVERAQAVEPEFRLNTATAPAVAEICVRLDGLPLALELAAARCRLLSPEAILDRLEHRFGLLTDGPRDVPARQQTLRDTIAWSHGLLDNGEQRLFARLGVFVGGWTVGAAQAVAAGEGAGDALEGIALLLDKNLILRVPEDKGEPRFTMLETIREYAREALEVTGGAQDASTRHAAWCLELAERAEPELTAAGQAGWFDRLEREHDNLRAALAWLRYSGEIELELRLAGALSRFWSVRGYLTEGRSWLEYALTSDDHSRSPARAKALRGAFVLALRQRDVASATAYANESLGLSTDLGDERGIARSIAYLALVEDDHDRARSLYEDASRRARETGDEWTLAMSVSNRGDLALNEGDYGQASALCSESLTLQRKLGDTRGMAISLNNLAYAALYEGRFREALAPLQESLTLAHELGDRDGIAYRLEGLSVVAAAQGDASRAARLLGGADVLFEGIEADLDPAERDLHERTLTEVRDRLGEEAFASAWAEGRAMGLSEAVAYAHDRTSARNAGEGR
jgi:predicted ATPase/DNA-binding SARP family transcriptional activator